MLTEQDKQRLDRLARVITQERACGPAGQGEVMTLRYIAWSVLIASIVL